MKIVNFIDLIPKNINNKIAKGLIGRILIGKNEGAKNFCMRFFELSNNGYTPRHSHDWEHEIFVVSGKGTVYCNGEWKTIKQHDSIYIPNNEEHQIKNIDDNILKFICIIPSGVPEL